MHEPAIGLIQCAEIAVGFNMKGLLGGQVALEQVFHFGGNGSLAGEADDRKIIDDRHDPFQQGAQSSTHNHHEIDSMRIEKA